MRLYIGTIESNYDAHRISLLSGGRISRLAACTSDKRRRELIAGGLLLRRALEELCELAPGDPMPEEILQPGGRPVFAESELVYSIAHTGDRVVCAVRRGGQLGVDAEYLRKFDKKVAARYFSDAENRWIAAQTDYDTAACTIWTRKESVSKAVGIGISAISALDTCQMGGFTQYQTGNLLVCVWEMPKLGVEMKFNFGYNKERYNPAEVPDSTR